MMQLTLRAPLRADQLEAGRVVWTGELSTDPGFTPLFTKARRALRKPGTLGYIVDATLLDGEPLWVFVQHLGDETFAPYDLDELEYAAPTVARDIVWGPTTGPHNERLKLLVSILGQIDMDVCLADLSIDLKDPAVREDLSVELIDMLLAPEVPTPPGYFY